MCCVLYAEMSVFKTVVFPAFFAFPTMVIT
jgi:hypothetical protein